MVELLVVVAIIALLAQGASAAFNDLIARRRLDAATSEVIDMLQIARSEAVRQMRNMTVTHPSDDSPAWALGISDLGDCDPSITDAAASGACTIRIGGVAALHRIGAERHATIRANATRPRTVFSGTRGTAMGSNASIRLDLADGRQVRVIIANIGRIRACSPSGDQHVSGYPNC